MTIEELHSAFTAYVEKVSRRLVPKGGRNDLKLLHTGYQLQNMAEGLEGLEQFKVLVKAAHDCFCQKKPFKNPQNLKHTVRTFSRRSGCYFDLFHGKPVDSDPLFGKFTGEFTKSHVVVHYLAPLEYVQFEEESISFKTFRIRRFKKNELDALLDVKINDIFYPWASANTEVLRQYWFLWVSKEKPNKATDEFGGVLHLDLNDVDIVRTEHSRFPKSVDSALQKLILYQWQSDFWNNTNDSDQLSERWLGFNIPFLLRVEDNLLSRPSRAPNFDVLDTVPDFHPTTDEEIGEKPECFISLDRTETSRFAEFARRIESIYELFPEGRWKFMDVALSCMHKAFYSDGLDQLLWHIAALEALLGERGRGVTKRLRRRLASIMADGSTERLKIDQQFDELYEFRSAWVHGDSFSRKVYVGHLRRAREFARRVLLWFLNYLYHVQSYLPEIADEIKREDILYQIDISSENLLPLAKSVHLNQTIKQSFEHFPHVQEWWEK